MVGMQGSFFEREMEKFFCNYLQKVPYRFSFLKSIPLLFTKFCTAISLAISFFFFSKNDKKGVDSGVRP